MSVLGAVLHLGVVLTSIAADVFLLLWLAGKLDVRWKPSKRRARR